MEALLLMGQDFSACLSALVNALEAKGVLTRSEVAAAAQERLLVLREALPLESIEQLPLLHLLATELERIPPDVP